MTGDGAAALGGNTINPILICYLIYRAEKLAGIKYQELPQISQSLLLTNQISSPKIQTLLSRFRLYSCYNKLDRHLINHIQQELVSQEMIEMHRNQKHLDTQSVFSVVKNFEWEWRTRPPRMA